MNTATVKNHQTFSKVWLIPIIAIIIGGWMTYIQWANQGTLISIEVTSAVGIEANKTPIKVRDVEVGKVKEVTLNESADSVEVIAQINKNAQHLVTEKSKFWIVSPRVTLSEVSGLNTLLSGSYIAMSGDGQGRKQTHFTILPRPPATPEGTPGLFVTLTSDKDFSYKEGDAIVYKGHKVGQFENSYFNQYEKAMYYTAFVNAPYHRLINKNTRFWDATGVKIRLRASGLEIDTGSIETLLSNGVSFGEPDGVAPGEPIVDKSYFEIFKSEEDAQAKKYRLSAEYVLLIDDSVRGLNEGAPVEYRGLNVGEVVSINKLPLESSNILQEDFRIPVVVNIYPGKVRQPDTAEGLSAVRLRMTQWLEKDLRATLRMGSLVTGALYIDLHHVKNDKGNNKSVQKLLDYEVIPTASNEFTQITQKAEALLDKLNDLPLDAITAEASEAISAMIDAADSVQSSSDDFDALLEDVDMKAMNEQLLRTLANVANLTESLSANGLEEDVQDTIKDVQTTLRELQPLIQQLNESPSSLLFFNNSSGVDIQPKAKQDK